MALFIYCKEEDYEFRIYLPNKFEEISYPSKVDGYFNEIFCHIKWVIINGIC